MCNHPRASRKQIHIVGAAFLWGSGSMPLEKLLNLDPRKHNFSKLLGGPQLPSPRKFLKKHFAAAEVEAKNVTALHVLIHE